MSRVSTGATRTILFHQGPLTAMVSQINIDYRRVLQKGTNLYLTAVYIYTHTHLIEHESENNAIFNTILNTIQIILIQF